MELTALVVDDSRIMRNMVMQNLKKTKLTRLAEFKFVEAEDGAVALSKFSGEAIDLAFVDWNMPNMTGIEFVRQVRAMDGTGHIPMVMVTSEKAMGKVEEALDSAGANAYICKPFTPDDMERKLFPIIEELIVAKQKQAEPAPGGGFLSRLFS